MSLVRLLLDTTNKDHTLGFHLESHHSVLESTTKIKLKLLMQITSNQAHTHTHTHTHTMSLEWPGKPSAAMLWFANVKMESKDHGVDTPNPKSATLVSSYYYF
jgi:hypothetical protein